MDPIDGEALERLEVVANAAMNRGRGLSGVNSYQREVGLDIVAFLRERGPGARWMDLCCGAGVALVDASRQLPDACLEGIDLVDMFVPHQGVTLTVASVRAWKLSGLYDLITCVHGLHYVADKLALLTVAAGALRPGGRFIANLDVDNIAVPGGRRALQKAFCARGFTYHGRTHRISCTASDAPQRPFSWEFTGADPGTGPNYTMQPAVTSIYATEAGSYCIFPRHVLD